MQLGLDLSQIRQATGLIAEEMEKLSRACFGAYSIRDEGNLKTKASEVGAFVL